MLGLVVVVVLGAAVLAGEVVARRLRLAPPVVLLLFGALLGFVPALRGVHRPSEAVLLLFLLRCCSGKRLTISLRGSCSNLRGIVLNSTALDQVLPGRTSVRVTNPVIRPLRSAACAAGTLAVP